MDSPSKGLVSGALRDNEQEERIGAIERRLGGSILTQTDEQREALQNKLATGTQGVKDKLNAFRDYVQTGGNVELNDDYIIAAVTQMETAGVIGAGRAAQILA